MRFETRKTEPQPGIERPRNGKISARQIIDAGLLGQSAQRHGIETGRQFDPHIHAAAAALSTCNPAR